MVSCSPFPGRTGGTGSVNPTCNRTNAFSNSERYGNTAWPLATLVGNRYLLFLHLSEEETARLEEDYARAETPVVSNNSAHRWTPDVPMMNRTSRGAL